MGTRRKFYISAASLFVAVGIFTVLLTVMGTSASALTMGDRRDCGYTDVIIDCGAISQTELLQKYDSNNDGRGNRDIQAIFNHYGIGRGDIAGTSSEVKRGWLNTDGVITVDGKTVATGAESLYRVDPADKQVSPVRIAGKTYYIGPVANNYSKGADVFVFFRNGTFYAAIQSSCGNVIVAKPSKPEPKPEYACKNLTATKLDRTRYRFTASATAEGGAEIVGYTFHFGDSSSETTTSNTIEHTYAAAGSYNVQVDVNFKVNGDRVADTDENCKTTIKVEEKPEYCPLPGKEHLPKDSPDCVQPPCEIPGKEHLPKDSPECVVTPPELPKTGLDMFISGGLGLGSITAALHYWVGSRKNLLSALLDR